MDLVEAMILWRAIGVGCVVIWPVTIPALAHSRLAWAMLALLIEVLSNPGRQNQKEVEKDVCKFDWGASMYYTMRLGINTLWIMQVSCTSHSDSNKLLLTGRLRRKNQMKQNIKKALC